MREAFMEDLQRIYEELLTRQRELGGYYELLSCGHAKAEAWVGDFLNALKLPLNDESRMAALTRLIALRDDALGLLLEKEGLDEAAVIAAKEQAYLMVADFYLAHHLELLEWIEEEALLTPFYRELIKGAHLVGEAMSRWQSSWTAQIINGVNRELYELFNGDEEKIFEMLETQNLLDSREPGCVGDRCYSVLQKSGERYESVAYADAFADEVADVSDALETLIANLEALEDECFGQKKPWLDYLAALKDAFGHSRTDTLIRQWADVDRAWMRVTSPIQIGHPLEYYEDHYRKAVALEWDVRLASPKLQQNSLISRQMIAMLETEGAGLGNDAAALVAKGREQIERTQLYIGVPALFYGAEFQGLFSAQVVPNDTEVSKEAGKKIFAFADNVLESKKSRPVMRIAREILGDALVREQRDTLFARPDLWHKVYEITTIGHEYGHILWVDDDTEVQMNGGGNYKNVEEFKATTGGLVTFLMHDETGLANEVLTDTLVRAVGLMAWRNTDEVEPYYVEGLLHLDILFEAGVLTFDDNRLTIDRSDAAYQRQKELYLQRYRELFENFYWPKRDASGFLEKYLQKEDGVWRPKAPRVDTFVEHYWSRYKAIGQQTMPFAADDGAPTTVL